MCLVKIPMGYLGLEVEAGSVGAGEGTGCLDDNGSTGLLALEADIKPDAVGVADGGVPGKERVVVVGAILGQLLIVMDDEVPAISGCLALALVDAVYRVVATYLLAQGVELDVSFAFIAVGVDDEVGCRVGRVAEA